MNYVKYITFLHKLICNVFRKEDGSAASGKRGAAAVTALLFLAGGIAVAAFVVDSTRMTADAAQLKHATDAAAMATALAYARDSSTDVQEMAEQYVLANLGFDDEQIGTQLEVTVAAITKDEYDGFRVTADFKAEPSMLGGTSQPVTVSSAAVAIYNPMELALIIPNTNGQDSSDLAALNRLGMYLAEEFVEGKNDRWLSLVPYSQTVNVYDEDYPNRIRDWAIPAKLKPTQLKSLFRKNNYGIASMASRKMPDLQAERLALYRGLYIDENYFWTEAPSHSFGVRFRYDSAPTNNFPGMPYITWNGPNPTSCDDEGSVDIRYIVADAGCPTAALLPLTDDLDKIQDRLDEMETGFNTNFIIAVGWAATALSPAFRGTSGWGDEEHPLDFSSDTSTNIKAMIMLGKPNGLWFDTDSYNFYPCDNKYDSMELYDVAQERAVNMCNDLRSHDIKFYFIGVGDKSATARQRFEKYLLPALQENCAESADNVTFLDSTSFAGGEDEIKARLDEIISDLEGDSSYARLVE